MSEDNFIIVDVHYNGNFICNPIIYFDPRIASVRDIDFASMDYNGLLTFLRKLMDMQAKDLYYCLPSESLSEGIKGLFNDGDYQEFIECAYAAPGRRINLYVDHHNEPIFDWIENEEIIDEDYEEPDDDVHKPLPDPIVFYHEDDGFVAPLNRTAGDPFLNALCPKQDIQVENEADDADDDEDVPPPQYPTHNPNQEWNLMRPMLGMKFIDPDQLKHCLSNYAATHGYDLYYEKNNATRLLVKCCKKNKDPVCPFRLWATWMSQERTFQIKSLIDRHECARTFKLGSIVTFKWIGKHFTSEILEKPTLSLRKMKTEISKKYNLNVSVGQCRNAKKFALGEIEGTLVEHYGRLWSYAEEIRRANPGSTVKMEVDIMPDSKTYFSRYYVCISGCRDAWVGNCRRVIGVDGCFLKGICEGELITAMGRDPNNHIYPIAWAVVAVENKATWKWFLDLLMDDIDGGQGNGLTILSDGHKGLMQAVKERLPHCEHRLCARHVLANFWKRFPVEQYKDLFWKAVYATTPQAHQLAMDELKSYDIQEHDYLVDRDPKTWSKAFFQ